MTRSDLVIALINANMYRGQCDLDDIDFSPYSQDFVAAARTQWVRSLPDELTYQQPVGGGVTIRTPLWIPEVWDCDNLGRSFGMFLSICMAVDAVRTKTKRGNSAGGIIEFLVTPTDPASGHVINWWCDHEGKIHVIDAASNQIDHLVTAQIETIRAVETL